MAGVNKNAKLAPKIGAGILLMAAFGQFAHADGSGSAFVMTVIADRAQGERLISGDYPEAIEAITSPKRRKHDRFAESNNLCVAYTKTNNLIEAGQACSDALETSQATSGPGYEAHRARGNHAVALSNRGVIRAINGDRDGARRDFERAIKLNDNLAASAANLAHLAHLDRHAAEKMSSL